MRTSTFMALTCMAIAACNGDGDLPPTDLCDETGAAIAAQALACTGDPNVSNAQYNLFVQNYQCQLVLTDTAYACAGAMPTAPCADVVNPSLEELIKRTVPVCTQVVNNNPNSTLPVIQPGEAHVSGMFNSSTTNYTCTFAPQTATQAPPNGPISSVLASAACGNGTIGFNLAFTGSSVAQVQSVVFPTYNGTNDAVLTSESVSFTKAFVDAYGYTHAKGSFNIVGNGAQVSYNLNGTFDLVLEPSQ